MSLKLRKKVGSLSISTDNWQEKRRKLKEEYPHSSDSDLRYTDGTLRIR